MSDKVGKMSDPIRSNPSNTLKENSGGVPGAVSGSSSLGTRSYKSDRRTVTMLNSNQEKITVRGLVTGTTTVTNAGLMFILKLYFSESMIHGEHRTADPLASVSCSIYTLDSATSMCRANLLYRAIADREIDARKLRSVAESLFPCDMEATGSW